MPPAPRPAIWRLLPFDQQLEVAAWLVRLGGGRAARRVSREWRATANAAPPPANWSPFSGPARTVGDANYAAWLNHWARRPGVGVAYVKWAFAEACRIGNRDLARHLAAAHELGPADAHAGLGRALVEAASTRRGTGVWYALGAVLLMLLSLVWYRSDWWAAACGVATAILPWATVRVGVVYDAKSLATLRWLLAEFDLRPRLRDWELVRLSEIGLA